MYARDFKGLISMMKVGDTYTFKRNDWEDTKVRYDVMRETKENFTIRVWDYMHIVITVHFTRLEIMDKEGYEHYVIFYNDGKFIGQVNLRYVGLKMMKAF